MVERAAGARAARDEWSGARLRTSGGTRGITGTARDPRQPAGGIASLLGRAADAWLLLAVSADGRTLELAAAGGEAGAARS